MNYHSNNNRSQPFGEIVESTLFGWKAECWNWNSMPPFGSLITTQREQMTLFGLVAHIETGPRDESRQPYPFQKTEQELLHEQPQIFALLRTRLTCITLGFQEKECIYYQIAPYPAKIHAFVQQATSEQQKEFFNSTHYLTLLNNSVQPPLSLDELLLSLLQYLIENNIFTHAYLTNLLTNFSLITGTDYRRTKLLLQRITLLLKHYQNYGSAKLVHLDNESKELSPNV